MWRKYLTSLGIFSIALTGCNPELLIAKDSSDYEVVALIAR